MSLFGLRVFSDAVRSPFEILQIGVQIAEIGYDSLLLIVASGFALGAVMSLHTRSSLVTFGATSLIYPPSRRMCPSLRLARASPRSWWRAASAQASVPCSRICLVLLKPRP